MTEEDFGTNLENCVYLGNFYDPRNEVIEWPLNYIESGETAEISRSRYRLWIETKTIAEPRSSYIHSKELAEKGMVGVYYCADRGDVKKPIQSLVPTEDEVVDDVTFFSKLVDDMNTLARELTIANPEQEEGGKSQRNSSMDELLRSAYKKSQNSYLKGIVRFPIILFSLLGLVSLLSDTGFGDEIQEHRLWIWLISLVIALLLSVVMSARDFREDKKAIFRLDKENGICYLKDLNGQLREIPDDRTLTFLSDALGTSRKPIELSRKDIEKRLGAKLTSTRDWERPKTPEEKEKRELQRSVSRSIRKKDLLFRSDSAPQEINVQFWVSPIFAR